MTFDELNDEMAERCEYVIGLHRDPDASDDAGGMAMGGVVLCDSGEMVAAEIGLTASGQAQITVRAFDAEGRPRTPVVMELGEEILITTMDRCQIKE